MNPLFPAEYLIIAFLAIFAGIVYLSWYTCASLSFSKRVAIVLLRSLVVVILAIIAFDPGKWLSASENQHAEWAIMLDASESMSVKDANKRTRFQAAKEIAEKLKKVSGDINIFPFANNIMSTDLMQLQPTGSVTDIFKSGTALVNKYMQSQVNLKGIILLSDGRQIQKNDKDNFAALACTQNAAVYPVVIGHKVKKKDIELKLKRKYFLAYTGQQIKVPVQVINQNMGKLKLNVSLCCAGGNSIDNKLVNIENNQVINTDITLDVKEKGYTEYQLQIKQNEGENSTVNNQTKFAVSVLDKKLNILLVEGRPFWDSKFLAQTLRLDPNINLTTIYRLSAKRYFAVSNNDEASHEAQRSIFPDTSEAISKYDIIILGKGMEYFLSIDRIQLLKNFLKENGGSVIMARGKPYTRKLQALSALEPVEWGSAMQQEYKLSPSPEGIRTGLFGDMLPDKNDSVWGELPALNRAWQCPHLKTFALPLLTGHFNQYNKEQQVPVLIGRKYGKGMVLAVNLEGLWKWSFFPTSGKISTFYKEFWIQIVHWLVKHADYLPGQNYSLHISQTLVLPGNPLNISVSRRCNSKEKQTFSLKIVRGKKVIQTLTDCLENGQSSWNRVLTFNESGMYHVKLTYENGKSDKTIYSMFMVKAPPKEMDNLNPDPAFLSDLAADSGGRMVTTDELQKMVSEKRKKDNIQQLDVHAEWQSVWDRWWGLCLVLILLAGDFFIRRRNGLL